MKKILMLAGVMVMLGGVAPQAASAQCHYPVVVHGYYYPHYHGYYYHAPVWRPHYHHHRRFWVRGHHGRRWY
jgi:hypothetical protein